MTFHDGKPLIYLADLNHHMRSSYPHFFPLGIGSVGAYLLDKLGGSVEVELFRYPEDLSDALDHRVPQIIGFSNYLWNLNLSYEYAKIIKSRFPETVVVMGGPNYDLENENVEAFWKRYAELDFYIVMEGEQAFVELVQELGKNQFDANAVKKRGGSLQNCYYLHDGIVYQGDILPRIKDFDQLPSPYLAGLMDKFFDGKLVLLIQTARGCPFQCTFCIEGLKYYNSVMKKLDLEEELEYIAQRVQGPNLCLADANWGMFQEDVEKAKVISKIRKKYDWPKHIFVNVGKNKKERVLEVASILDHVFSTGGAVQSTDPEILKNVKRSNIGLDGFAKNQGLDNYSEIMVGLPGDSLQAHTKTLKDVVDNNFRKMRVHQTVLLPHTEMNSQEERKKFNLKTKFQVLARAFGRYELLGETFTAVEYQELCIANDTMTMDEYLDCRELDLTVESIYDKTVTFMLFDLFRELNLSWFDVILSTFGDRRNFTPALAELYDAFRDHSQSRFWEDPDELVAYVKTNIDEYLKEDNDHKDTSLGYAKEVLRTSKDFSNLLFKKIKGTLFHEGHLNRERIYQLNSMKNRLVP